jgi:hypothetical protein
MDLTALSMAISKSVDQYQMPRTPEDEFPEGRFNINSRWKERRIEEKQQY